MVRRSLLTRWFLLSFTSILGNIALSVLSTVDCPLFVNGSFSHCIRMYFARFLIYYLRKSVGSSWLDVELEVFSLWLHQGERHGGSW